MSEKVEVRIQGWAGFWLMMIAAHAAVIAVALAKTFTVLEAILDKMP